MVNRDVVVCNTLPLDIVTWSYRLIPSFTTREQDMHTVTLTVELYSLGPNADFTNLRAELEEFLDGPIQYTHQVAAVVTGNGPRPSTHTVVDTGEGVVIRHNRRKGGTLPSRYEEETVWCQQPWHFDYEED